MPRAIAIGEPAPDFSLPGVAPEGRGEFTLSAQRGAPVVLAFYPGDETLVCTREMCSYERGLETFDGLSATLWGISPQGLESHEKFAAHRSLTFPLLADTDKKVAELYGVYGRLMIKRGVFVIDAHGILRWSRVSKTGLTYPSVDEIGAVLGSLTSEPYPASGPTTERAEKN